MKDGTNNTSLMSSHNRIEVPWISVKLGEYVFGVQNKAQKKVDNTNFYSEHVGQNTIKYPNYVKGLTIKKTNGLINLYSLEIEYPVRVGEDPNFFEKVFSSISSNRKMILNYGDAKVPEYTYKDEEAIITNIRTGFNFGSSGSTNSILTYVIEGVSSAKLSLSGAFSFGGRTNTKPSTVIREIFTDTRYGLGSVFTGMNADNFWNLVDSNDEAVNIESKVGISPLEYIKYLVSNMIPAGTINKNRPDEVYVLTVHDDTIYDTKYNTGVETKGPYFRVSKVSSVKKEKNGFEIDIGYNSSTVVTNFSIQDNENYAILYDYNAKLNQEEYTRVLNSKGMWEDVYAPTFTSGNETRQTRPEDKVWYSKLTKFPISGTLTIQGLLKPALLTQNLRLNVIFPGGKKHISSGLYIITSQTDRVDGSGYRTTLGLTKVAGDTLSEDEM